MKSRNKTKALIILVCVLLLVVSSTIGTLAYLSDSRKATNTFTMGQVRIRLDEATTDVDGNPIRDYAIVDRIYAWRNQKGNQYHLIPGSSYTKDPTVTVLSGSEPAYIRVLLTFSAATPLQAITGNLTEKTDIHGWLSNSENPVDKDNLAAFLLGWEKDIWQPTSSYYDEVRDTLTLELRYCKPIEGCNPDGEDADVILAPVMEGFHIDGNTATSARINALRDAKFKITVVAQAIQAENFSGPYEAWKSFETPVEALPTLPTP